MDIHIQGGTVVDGTRAPRRIADVWIKDGKVQQIGGESPGPAKQTIDAKGLVVAPGFVDLHTHYDAQIRWDPYCTISGWHGVTSVVLGNCGFGFAPVKPEFQERSMLTMVRTEAIPYDCMKQGMLWDWETIPEYIESLSRAPLGVNCIQYMPTASLMTYVMGLEAAKTRVATKAEQKEMQRLLHEGMEAGLLLAGYRAVGFTKKMIVILDKDIYPTNLNRVIQAIGTRWQPDPASLIVKQSFHIPLEPSSKEMFLSSKIIIDATRQMESEGGPETFPLDNRTALEEKAEEAFDIVDKRWDEYFGK